MITPHKEDLTRGLMFYLIYLTSLGKVIKCGACRSLYRFVALSSINSIIHKPECLILVITCHLNLFCHDFANTCCVLILIKVECHELDNTCCVMILTIRFVLSLFCQYVV